jgi:hypothetical protein
MAAEIMQLDWLPDWRDASQYPHPARAPLRIWPWEFLRRNPEYQTMWQELILPFFDYSDHSFDNDAAMEAAREQAKLDPEYQRISSGGEGSYTVKSPCAVFREKFGVMLLPPPPGMSDPRLSLEHYWIGGRDRPSLKYLPTDQPYEFQLSLAPAESVITFDLAWPIEPQLERVRKWLEGRQSYLQSLGELEPVRHNNHTDKFPNYLRILDAEMSGASQKEMAAKIFPDLPNEYPDRRVEDRVRYALDAAKRLRDSGYRYIVQ